MTFTIFKERLNVIMVNNCHHMPRTSHAKYITSKLRNKCNGEILKNCLFKSYYSFFYNLDVRKEA